MLTTVFEQAKLTGSVLSFRYHNKYRACRVREYNQTTILTDCCEPGSLDPAIKRFHIGEMENVTLHDQNFADLLGE